MVKKPLAGHGDTNSPDDSAVKGGVTEAPTGQEDHPNKLPTRSSPPSSPSLTHREPAEVLTSNADSAPVHATPAPPTLSAKPQSASVQPLSTEVPPTLPTAEAPSTLAAHHGRRPEADGMVISQDGDSNEHRLMVRPHDANLRPGNFQVDPRMYAPRQRLQMQPRYPSPQWNDPPHSENHPQGPSRTFTRYPPSGYVRDFHDPRMPHAPQSSGRTQPTHGPPTHGPQLPLQYGENEHQAGPSYPRNGGYHEGPYHDPRNGFDGYREDFWHPPSSLYYGVGGMYQDGYGREYPNDSDNGGRAP